MLLISTVHSLAVIVAIFLTSQALTWEQAQAEAESYGGNLVTINDAAEQQWLQSTFGNQWFWTGLNDAETDGNWQWASGEAVTYTNWALYHPGGVGDYVMMNYGTNHQWANSLADRFGVEAGIIEIDWSSVNGKDTIIGGAGNDEIYGNSGNDSIYGDNLNQNQEIPSDLTAPNITNGLVSHWEFDEGSGSTVTSSVYNKTDDLNEDLSSGWVDGIFGTALNFDGSGDTVTVAHYDAVGLTNNITLSAWIKPDSIDDGDGIISKGYLSGDSYAMNLTAAGNLVFKTDAGEWQSNSQVNTDQWQHVAISYDGSSLKFYINGQQDSNVVSTNMTLQSSLDPIQIGSDTVNFNFKYFDGVIDDARIYNRALSTNEIGSLALVDTDLSNNPVYNEVSGNDELTGNGGHDILVGGAGDDMLNGTDPIVAGYLERDVLSGGAGADKFILGDATKAYYATEGAQDYAVIQDFDSTVDTIQFNGVAGNYQQQQQGNDLHLTNNGDLVAILENTNTLNLNGSAFEYV